VVFAAVKLKQNWPVTVLSVLSSLGRWYSNAEWLWFDVSQISIMLIQYM